MQRSKTRLTLLLAALAAATILVAPGVALAAGTEWYTGTGGQQDTQAQGLATGQTVVTRGTYTYSTVGLIPQAPADRLGYYDAGGRNVPGVYTLASGEALRSGALKPWQVLGTEPDAGLNLPNADGTFYQQRHVASTPAGGAPEAPAAVTWPTQERQYGANARVSYRTARAEFAGTERLADTRTRTWTEHGGLSQQPRTETLDLGTTEVGPRREGPYLVTDVYRTTGTRTVTTYTWRERQVAETTRVYETPYYYHVTVYRDVTVPGHYEKRPVQETRYWTRTVRETVQIPVTKTVTVPETRYREVQETRYWTRTVRETVQVPVTRTVAVPEMRYRWEQREYTRTVRVPVQVPVQETRYRTVWRWYEWGGCWYRYPERVPYTVTVWKTVYRDQVVRETRWVQVPYTVYVTKTVTGYRTVTRERVIQEPYTVAVVKPYTVYVTKTVTEYQTVTRERLVREPYTVTVQKDVWVPERSFTEVASRYDTTAPHRYSYRTDASVAYGPWEDKRLVDFGPLRATTAYERRVQRVGWNAESAPAAGGPQPPKIRPVITIADAEKYPWSNYSQHHQEIKARLMKLEGDYWKQVNTDLWPSEEEIARMYGYELVKVPAQPEGSR